MSGLLPFLQVHGPDGEEFTVELKKDHLAIGRFAAFNDIGLEPDPQQLITRKAHCSIEHQSDAWVIVDNGSVNRTFIERAGQVEIVTRRVPLQDGDTIKVLGLLTEEGDPLYWELIFRDPLRTNRVVNDSPVACLEYDWIQARLLRIEGSHREEIRLRPQEHKLIRYMEQRNRANGNIPVMCTYDELINAVWGDEIGHTESEINHLIYGLRQKIEIDARSPRFLQIVQGLGYRLETNPQPG
jgi:DNA-binding winged helix-turn-helix (wHTH) protein